MFLPARRGAAAHGETAAPPTLSSLGVDKNLAKATRAARAMGEKVFEQHVAMSGGKSETVFRLFSLQVATFMWVRAVRAQPLSPSEGPSPIIRTKPSLREKGGGGGSGTHSGYPFFPPGGGGCAGSRLPH
jgi:hypothetical protein